MGEPDSPLLFGWARGFGCGPFFLCPETALSSRVSGCHRGVSDVREPSGRVLITGSTEAGNTWGNLRRNPAGAVSSLLTASDPDPAMGGSR